MDLKPFGRFLERQRAIKRNHSTPRLLRHKAVFLWVSADRSQGRFPGILVAPEIVWGADSAATVFHS